MSSLCIAAGKLLVVMPVASFTLAWTHSIEKTRWEEDWQIRGGQLSIREARIKGSGAGMEPPSGALLENGIWHYRPATQPSGSVLLTHSPYTAGYEFCTGQSCQSLSHLLPGIDNHATIELSVCPDQSR
jgi:hypothetical protein